MQSNQFTFDNDNYSRTVKIPLIIGAALGITTLFHMSLGYIYSVIFLLLEAYGGGLYMKNLLDSGIRPKLINAGLNGALITITVVIVNYLLSWLSSGITYKEWVFDFGYLIVSIIRGGFIGFLGSLAWLVYKIYRE